jgi:MFS family permease
VRPFRRFGKIENRPLNALLAANTISQIGNEFSTLAIPWFVLVTTGSASQTGITVAVGVVPAVIVGILGGVIIDRLGYRTTSIVSDIASGVSTLLVPLLYFTTGISFWQLLVLTFLGAVLDSPGRTARLAMFPEIVALTPLTLDRANAFYATTNRIAGVIGPPLAGLLIASLGAANLLWFNAVSFAISAGIVIAMVPTITTPVSSLVATTATGIRGYFHEIREGFRFLWHRQMLLCLIMVTSAGALISEPIYAIILPVYAKDVFSSAAPLGFIFAALGAGSLLGNLVYAVIVTRLSRSTILYAAFALRALCFVVFLFSPAWWVIAIAIFVCAVTFQPVNPMMMTILQEQIPAGMRGRVLGTWSAVNNSTLPFGILVYGFLMSSAGLDWTLTVFVAINLLAAFSIPLIRPLRDLSFSPNPDVSRTQEASG